MDNAQNRYSSVRSCGKMPQFPAEWTLRKLLKRGLLPGFFSGSRFYVDTWRLPDVLRDIGERQRQGEEIA